jgi:hypothetical protein
MFIWDLTWNPEKARVKQEREKSEREKDERWPENIQGKMADDDQVWLK